MSSYRNLRKTPEFSDVTLVCEDGQRIEAHRLVLASSSLFFQDLLQKEAHQRPLVFMRGLAHATLASLVDFIYYGEAEVKKANLEEFLKVAGELRVKGMTKPVPERRNENQDQVISSLSPEDKSDEGTTDDENQDPLIQEVQEVLNDIMKEKLDCDECGRTYGSKGSFRNHKNAHKKRRETLQEENENKMVKIEIPTEMISEKFDCEECGKTYGSKNSLRTHKYTHKKVEDAHSMNTSDTSEQDAAEDGKSDMDLSIGDNLLWEERIDALLEHGEGGWTCKQCGKHDRNKSKARNHIETHIEGFTFSCTACEKTFSKRIHLKKHMSLMRKHLQRRTT